MGKAGNSNKEIYLFIVGEDGEGFAEFSYAYRRKTWTSLADAIADVKQSSDPAQPPTSDWQSKKNHSARGLDLNFPDNTQALVFVLLPGAGSHSNVTAFGKRVVKDLNVPNNNPGNIVRQERRHQLVDNGPYLLCSFELDIGNSLETIGRSTTGHRISRRPIMFDFVDSDDNRSPVFKEPHKHFDGPDVHHEKERFGHGGIHPPSASSFILVD